MTFDELLDHYETLVTEMGEINQALGVVFDWLSLADVSTNEGAYDFELTQRNMLAVFNLAKFKMFSLDDEHSRKIHKCYKERKQ